MGRERGGRRGARDASGNEDLRPRDRSGLWREDRRRQTRGRGAAAGGDRGLPGREVQGVEWRTPPPPNPSPAQGVVAPPPPAPLLALNDVTAYYGDLQALFGVTLRVLPGEIVTLIGANGAGKTTILRVVS